MTGLAVPGEVADAEIVDEVPAYPHPVVIEWPARERDGYLLPGWGVTITDAVTGKLVTTVTGMDVVLHADPRQAITADLVMLADADGNPLPDGNTVWPDGDGGVRTGTWRAFVAEMRVRGIEPPQA